MDMELGVINFFFTYLTWSVGDFVVATTSQPLEDNHGIFCIKSVGDIFWSFWFSTKVL
jgi:hypothetical protein